MDISLKNKYRVVIGLEVHAQLLTQSKIFSSDSTAYGSKPNTNISVITLGHPGVMPKLNKQVVEKAIKMGLACNSEISRYTIFDRKNYFYPDLPKGYQITQDKKPICLGGYVPVKLKDGMEKNVVLSHIHMEEDAGKSIHLAEESDTLVDFNRAGVPLIEIVTAPVIESSEEANAFLSEVRKLVRYLDICDGNMEEGSLRCDANVSVMLKDAKEFGKKVEVKNMNSIRNVQRAIDHEIERQILALEAGKKVVSETRTFDADKGTTSGMRTKEELNDYRYFPEPDLSPLIVDEEWLERLKVDLPALPHELFEKFLSSYQLPAYDAGVLTDSKEVALFFDELCQKTKNYKAASNWVMGPIKSYLNEASMGMGDFPLAPETIASLIQLVDESKVSHSSAAQKIFPELLKNPKSTAMECAEKLNLIQESNEDSLMPIIQEVISGNPEKVNEYRKGKKGLLGMFMGEVMKKSMGKADPKKANEMLRKALAS